MLEKSLQVGTSFPEVLLRTKTPTELLLDPRFSVPVENCPMEDTETDPPKRVVVPLPVMEEYSKRVKMFELVEEDP